MAFKDIKIGFIGGGQMAAAIIKGLIESGATLPENILVSEPSSQRRKYLEETFPGIKVLFENCALVKKADLIILAVKPQIIKEVLKEITLCVDYSRHLIISIAAGIPLAVLEKCLPEKTRVVRVMPNTPALVQAGISVFTGGRYTTSEDLTLTRKFLEAFGKAVELPEAYFDAVTGLSGSGPAYIATFVEALIDAGVKVGLPRQVAEILAQETILGTLKLMQGTGKNPYEIKSMVTSPGGTTICGLKALEEGAFRATVMDAVEEATNRSKELTLLALKEED
ncbi:pyrroline-5-carboxylate reductase [Thermodesulfatator autotrophicus]|uniref:Pyrroline-5-carboxylate reductase n=1 Tax=Thermodesulfatator autotrophicus TaxID=1795632 RepID=A0A177E8H7_9BACT|nr:pyrroline-5-carboxylate reductase [Thermodesulfatator autotrophicus]OAG27319.1 pyrroline-5-carboxylate reductase [Thermodesulfatator autotrophicus]